MEPGHEVLLGPSVPSVPSSLRRAPRLPASAPPRRRFHAARGAPQLLRFGGGVWAASVLKRCLLGRRASISTIRKREEKRERRRRWLQDLQAAEPEPDEEEAVPSGRAPVFPSAEELSGGGGASSSTHAGRSGRSGQIVPEPLDWNNPGVNVLEKARLAAEDWGIWDEAGWSDPATSSGSSEGLPLPSFFRKRRAEAEAPEAIKEFIALHQLGKLKLPRLKRGLHRPAIFAGSDPAHDGRKGSVDDGRGDTLGRMAIAVHKGFLRQRARCHPSQTIPPERPKAKARESERVLEYCL